MRGVELIVGDCLDLLPTIRENSVDAVVTDPPAGIELMGKDWDTFKRGRLAAYKGPPQGRIDGSRKEWLADHPVVGQKANRRCRTCGHYAYSGTPCKCEHPNWTADNSTRDTFIAFLSRVMAECLIVAKPGAYALVWAIPRTSHWTGTAIEDAGWVIQDRISHLFGSGFPKHKSKLKPACEDWWLAWKPDRRATPLNIDGCRIACDSRPLRERRDCQRINGSFEAGYRNGCRASGETVLGRWPANVTHDGSEEVLAEFAKHGENKPCSPRSGGFRDDDARRGLIDFKSGCRPTYPVVRGDTGTAARFFYAAKASKADRGEGNGHPTVKNTELMRWLCRLITPPGGRVLDPFAGSGSTGVACIREGFRFLGVEQDEGYAAVARRRLVNALNEPRAFSV